MPSDLTPFSGNGSDFPDQTPQRGPYNSPHWLTPAGQQDRKLESEHVVAVRQVMREVERNRLETAKNLAADLDQIESDARRTTEQKFALQRAQKESQILGGDDPELRAKFGVLDDDLFTRYRQMGLGK